MEYTLLSTVTIRMWPFESVPRLNWSDEILFEAMVNAFARDPPQDALVSLGPSLPKEIVELIFLFLDGDRRGWRSLGLRSVPCNYYFQYFETEDIRMSDDSLIDIEFVEESVVGGVAIAGADGISPRTLRHSNAFDSGWYFYNRSDIHSIELDEVAEEMRGQVGMVSNDLYKKRGLWHCIPKWSEIDEMLPRVGNKKDQAKCRMTFIDQLVLNARQRQTFMYSLKASLCLHILQGTISVAAADTTTRMGEVSMLERVISNQMRWLVLTINALETSTSALAEVLRGGVTACYNLIDWELVLSILLYVALMAVMIRSVVVILTPFYWAARAVVLSVARWVFGFKLAPSAMAEPAADQVMITEAKDGSVSIALAKSQTPIRVEEMAMAGSSLCASAKRPIGAIMVVFENSELTLVGCFFRIDDYLMTAKHVASRVSEGVAEAYLVGVEETRRGTIMLRTSKPIRIERSWFDLDRNEFNCETLDVFARKLGTSVWGDLAIHKVSVKKPSCYKMTVSSCGFSNGVLQSGCGTTRKIKGSVLELGHTATTMSGFSGSPIFGGASVVGMHVAGQPDYNVCVRIEAIKQFLPVEESWKNVDREYEEKYKYDGEPESFERDHGIMWGVTASGRTRFVSEEELARNGYDSTDRVHYADFVSKTGRNWADDDSDDDGNYHMKPRRRKENSAPPPHKLNEKKASIIRRCEDRPPVHCGKVPAENMEVVEYMADREEEVKSLGYVKGEQAYPEINTKTEETSVLKHLELFGANLESCPIPPNEEEIERVVNILEEMLPSNKFEPRTGYKTTENFVRIIDSSLVNERKSAGVPYQSMGMATNGDVLRKIGKTGLAERVLSEWDDQILLKAFMKSEPAKAKKLVKGMPRIVLGFPVHKMIKNQALFRELLEVAVSEWKDSPIKYAFSPGNPGHVEHLNAIFKDKEVVECDKSTWDYNMYGYFFEILHRTVVRLAVQPADMTDDEFAQYKTDVKQAIDEVASGSQFVCTNGHSYELDAPGIMKSGWLLTIFANSLSQLALDTLIKIRLGMSDEEILNKDNVNCAGGDDTLQSFTAVVDLDNYVVKGAELGFKLEMKKHKEFLGSEFFSNVFIVVGGVIGFRPVRFTKHIEKMKRVKSTDLAMALTSAMINYCWDDKRYNFFNNMYRVFRKLNPEAYPLHLCKSKQYLRYKCKGMESDLGEDIEYVPLDEVLDGLCEQA